MSNWRIRDFHSSDMDGILHLWESLKADNVDPVYALSEVLASCEKDHAVVAVQGEQVVGAAVGRAAHDQGWIVFLATLPEFRGRGIGTSLLAAVENRMTPHGLNKLSALMPESETRVEAFLGRGFLLKQNLHYFERTIPVQRQELEPLSQLGGRILARDLWENVAGMRREKELLERRLVLPLAEADLADQFGVVPPRAVVLFGPPGTGKTTFAKAIASRLEWPFVEVFPSRLASDPKGLAGALRETFLEIAELEHAVVFIDEVEEIASQRSGEPPSPLQGVTNELLKIIPAFREQPGRLLVCATNFIRALDTAFLRHGRFDYVIPIGLPDVHAREAMWQRFIPASVVDSVDVALLVSRTEGFSPADIEYAARSASQRALEKAVYTADAPGDGASSGGAVPASNARKGPVTQDYLDAIADTRTTVSDEVHQDFLEDIDSLARVGEGGTVNLFLTILSGVAWTTVYICAIRIGFRDKTYAIPAAALGLNFAWEVIYSVHSLSTRLSVQGVINIAWALADVAIVYTFFAFGRRELPGFVTRPLFIGWAALLGLASFAVQWLFITEFDWDPASRYAAFLQNLLMSGLFIAMFAARRSLRGQSLVIAVAKWIGTLAPTITFGVLENSLFILGIGVLCSIFDLTYIGLLLWAKRNPGALSRDRDSGGLPAVP